MSGIGWSLDSRRRVSTVAGSSPEPVEVVGVADTREPPPAGCVQVMEWREVDGARGAAVVLTGWLLGAYSAGITWSTLRPSPVPRFRA